jgi:peptidoglycan/xylan/chitin deacetylase (PgdA/CDA1 family)
LHERIDEPMKEADTPGGALVPGKRWRPSLWLRASALLHGGAVAITVARPLWWPWTVGAVLANHLQLVAAGLTPRSSSLGSNWTRLPSRAAARGAVAITIDDGPDPKVTPQVLAILAAHRVRATFFCIGERVERFAAEARACAAAGHELENHSYHHSARFSLFGAAHLRREIERGQRAIAEITGRRPLFFRAPAGLRNPLLDPVLQQLGLQLVSWTRRGFDTVTCDIDTVLRRLTRDLAAGDILLLHDGHAAQAGTGKPVVLEVLPRLLEALERRALTPVTLSEALE